MFGDVPCVFGSLPGRSYQYGALDGIADWDQWSDREMPLRSCAGDGDVAARTG
jgi:hypothetical protein